MLKSLSFYSLSAALMITAHLLLCKAGHAQGTATWTGALNTDWNNAANWSWSGGSGVPGATDTVIIPPTANKAHIPAQATASCRELRLGVLAGDSVILYLDTAATLSLWGHMDRTGYGRISSTVFEDESTTLNMLGAGDQRFYPSRLVIGTMNVDKPSGNVTFISPPSVMSIDTVYIQNALHFLSQPVPVGAYTHGSIYMYITSFVFKNNERHMPITTTAYQANEAPPRLISDVDLSCIIFPNDLTGDLFVPVSTLHDRYSPVTIHSVGESWYVKVWEGPRNFCNDIYNYDQAVNETWIIRPTNGLELKINSDHPATISMTFHSDNNTSLITIPEVPANFNPNQYPLNIWQSSYGANCWNICGTAPMPARGYVTVTTPPLSTFSQLAIVPDTIQAGTGIDREAHQLNNIRFYPNPVTDMLNLDLGTYEGNTLQIDVLNVLGQTVIARQFDLSARDKTLSVSLQAAAPGIYTLRLSDRKSTTAFKFIKQ